MSKTKDYGVVLLPNAKCRQIDREIKQKINEILPAHQQAINNTHVTLYHMANVNEDNFPDLKNAFIEFAEEHSQYPVKLITTAVKATGGSETTGYKWLDIQFENVHSLVDIRESTLTTFKNFHSGILTRMHDDMNNFNQDQLAEIDEYGVTVYPYIPHVTSCYINLPTESKTVALADIANSYNNQLAKQSFDASAIALVELGRNGNAHTILYEVDMTLAGDSALVDDSAIN